MIFIFFYLCSYLKNWETTHCSVIVFKQCVVFYSIELSTGNSISSSLFDVEGSESGCSSGSGSVTVFVESVEDDEVEIVLLVLLFSLILLFVCGFSGSSTVVFDGGVFVVLVVLLVGVSSGKFVVEFEISFIWTSLVLLLSIEFEFIELLSIILLLVVLLTVFVLVVFFILLVFLFELEFFV